MSKDKVTSQELVEQVANRLSVSKRVAEEFLKSLFSEIEDALLKGDAVKIKNLGTFKLQWNEPRKSVNVQTGEVIVIEGYNKVTFTPDNELKDNVNAPYAHLEPVELGDVSQQESEDIKMPETVEQTPEPLRNLSEQASEIKNILSEIKLLSAKNQKKEIRAEQPSTRYEIPDYDLILIDEDTEDKPEVNVEIKSDEINTDTVPTEHASTIVVEEPADTETIPTIEEKTAIIVNDVIFQSDEITGLEVKEHVPEIIQSEIISDNKTEVQNINEKKSSYNTEQDQYTENEVQPSSASSNIYYSQPAKTINTVSDLNETVVNPFILKKRRKTKGLKTIFWILFLMALTGGGLYLAYGTSSCFSCWVKYSLLSDENKEIANGYITKVKSWFGGNDEKVNPQKTPEKVDIADSTILNDSLQTTIDSTTTLEKDSFQIAFDKRRNYNVFIGEEEISEGIRLTNIAQKYYGKREFWVYIYEANRDNIVHPDRITPGTIVRIPKVNPILIDKKNPRCLEKARELHDLYVGKK